jgi:hypothetical protein
MFDALPIDYGKLPCCLWSATKDVLQAVVPLAERISNMPFRIALQGKRDRERPRPRLRVVDCRLVLNRVRVDAREALGERGARRYGRWRRAPAGARAARPSWWCWARGPVDQDRPRPCEVGSTPLRFQVSILSQRSKSMSTTPMSLPSPDRPTRAFDGTYHIPPIGPSLRLIQDLCSM